MKSFSTENLTSAESTRRFVLTAIIFAFFFANPGIPAWVTFIALYPFTTAVLKWDPLNALLEIAATKIAHRNTSSNNLHGAI